LGPDRGCRAVRQGTPVETLTKKQKRQQRRRERKADRFMRKRSKDHLRDPLPDTDQLYDDFLKREKLDVELAPILPGGINMTHGRFCGRWRSSTRSTTTATLRVPLASSLRTLL
jgi:hypothetical protein